MKDFIIDACKWYVTEEGDEKGRLESIARFKARYEHLIGFLIETGLFKKKFPTKIEQWLNFELHMSDFTDEGLELVMRCHDRWLDALDRGCRPNNINL